MDIKRAIVVFSIFCFTLFSQLVLADESTIIINLRDQIIKDLNTVKKIQQSSERRKTTLVKEIKNLDREYNMAPSQKQKDKIAQEYWRAKADLLELDANNVTRSLEFVKSINGNLSLLNEEFRKTGEQDGLSLGAEDIALIESTLIGFDQSLATLIAIDPTNPDYNIMAETLGIMDGTYRRRFDSSTLEDLDQLMKNLTNIETNLEAVKRFLRVEIQRNRVKIFTRIKVEILDRVRSIMNSGGMNMVSRYASFDESDKKMSGDSGNHRINNGYYNMVGTGKIGRGLRK